MANLVPINSTGSVLRVGQALPWNVHDEHGVLLLSRGSAIDSEFKLQKLLARAAFADTADGSPGKAASETGANEDFFERFDALELRLSAALRVSDPDNFVPGLREIAVSIEAMVEKHPDLLIFSIIRTDELRLKNYGITHSIDVAAVCALLTHKSEMDRSTRESLIFAALTMNLSVLGLQAKLAQHVGPPGEAQKAEIHAHPLASAAMLMSVGVTGSLWLQAVEEHHEIPGGTGYPCRLRAPGELGQIIRLVDIFLAKHSPRGTREGLPAKKAAKGLYFENKGQDFAGGLIKEFGLYPPGCYVKLANGELGVVVLRGKTAIAPLVAVIAGPGGLPVTRHARRDTSLSIYAIETTVPASAVRVRVTATKLFDRRET